MHYTITMRRADRERASAPGARRESRALGARRGGRARARTSMDREGEEQRAAWHTTTLHDESSARAWPPATHFTLHFSSSPPSTPSSTQPQRDSLRPPGPPVLALLLTYCCTLYCCGCGAGQVCAQGQAGHHGTGAVLAKAIVYRALYTLCVQKEVLALADDVVERKAYTAS
jgi:hypothetical protein